MEVYQEALKLLQANRRFALASVVRTSGSTPQKAGAKALFEADGTVHGTLGGGCLEAESRQRALRALDTGEATAFDLRLDEVEGWDDGLVCGGTVRIFLDPDVRKNNAAYTAMIKAYAENQRGVILTILHHPQHARGTAVWLPKEDFNSTAALLDPDLLQHQLEREQPAILSPNDAEDKDNVEIFVEPVLPPPHLVIAGCGHIGKATAHFAALAGFKVTAIDDRPSFANPKNLPDAHHVICDNIGKTLADIPATNDTYIVIVTRGHRHDTEALIACIHSPVAYLGLIGSRRKSLLLRRHLVDNNIATQEDVARVVSPIGLDIGAKTVPEIALSIVAQLVAVRRKQQHNAESLAIDL